MQLKVVFGHGVARRFAADRLRFSILRTTASRLRDCESFCRWASQQNLHPNQFLRRQVRRRAESNSIRSAFAHPPQSANLLADSRILSNPIPMLPTGNVTQALCDAFLQALHQGSHLLDIVRLDPVVSVELGHGSKVCGERAPPQLESLGSFQISPNGFTMRSSRVAIQVME